jgi:ubiquinone/menaquinone biosynthesis C-methylase UbiE
MDWHARYVQQARWTRDLREYLFARAGMAGADRVLEVGCGTGAILSEINTQGSLNALDLDFSALSQCRLNAPAADLARGNALALPYPVASFDISYCHFLLLWVSNPLSALQEMARVTRKGAYVLALAEPDYSARVDKPDELAIVGRWQTEALRRQGADPTVGGRLAELFFRAGLEILETGQIAMAESSLLPQEREMEWAVIESDLAGSIEDEDLSRLKNLDEAAWLRGDRVLQVPTYFAWGKVC